MITVYVSIGNSDDKLSQSDWSLYIASVRELLMNHAHAVHGEWYSLPDSPYQNACFCAELDQGHAGLVRVGLGNWAEAYHQDSIAWAEVPRTEFIPGVVRAAP